MMVMEEDGRPNAEIRLSLKKNRQEYYCYATIIILLSHISFIRKNNITRISISFIELYLLQFQHATLHVKCCGMVEEDGKMLHGFHILMVC